MSLTSSWVNMLKQLELSANCVRSWRQPNLICRLCVLAGRHWSTANALANVRVASQGLSFHGAHQNITYLVATHECAGVDDGEIFGNLINGAAFAGYLSSDLKAILDTEYFVATKTSQSGTSIVKRNSLATTEVAELNKIEQGFYELKSRIASCLEQLFDRAKVIVSLS